MQQITDKALNNRSTENSQKMKTTVQRALQLNLARRHVHKQVEVAAARNTHHINKKISKTKMWKVRMWPFVWKTAKNLQKS